MKVIKAPEVFDQCTETGISIFLAGSIEMDKADNWQAMVEGRFSKYENLTLLNPRRNYWDSLQRQSADNPCFEEQVLWELENLSAASYIFMYFDPDTISPISLLELGAHCEDGKMMVCCPDGYFRKGNVEIFCDYHGIRFDDKLSDALDNLEQLIKHHQDND